MKNWLFAFVVGAVTVGAGESQAQIYPGPGGSIVIPNPNGTYTQVHPSALNPHLLVPGTVRPIPGGYIYQGTDGLAHGTAVDPYGNVTQVNYDEGRAVRTGNIPQKGVASMQRGTIPGNVNPRAGTTPQFKVSSNTSFLPNRGVPSYAKVNLPNRRR